MQNSWRVFFPTTLLLAAACAPDDPAELEARVFSTESEDTLVTGEKDPREAALRFLRQRGANRDTEESLVLRSSHSGKDGVVHARFDQYLSGMRIAGAEIRVSVDTRGNLIHLIDKHFPIASRFARPASVEEETALAIAIGKLHPKLEAPRRAVRVEGQTTIYDRGEHFHSEPAVERVLIPTTTGKLEVGFEVESWTTRGNLLHYTLVDGAGRILQIEKRTQSDSYNVFTNHPNVTPQTVISGPAAGGTVSPLGWLGTGAQRSIDINGNNVHAYLDADANNAPDSGGTTVSSGNFLAVADLGVQPSTAGNRDVAVQNLFYLNNVVHDVLYVHGFTEAAGNFQNNNFGRGGARGADAVNAEAQDGGGTDNANFATPRDGRAPRMQMYLWSGRGTHQVVVSAPASIAGTYTAEGAAFGGVLDQTGLSGGVVLVNDGTGTTSDGCEAFGGVSGQIALIDRGTCAFTIKVANAQAAGAIAVIIANNAGDSAFTMGGEDPAITIPAVMVGQSDGATLRSVSGVVATVRASDPAPLMVDGDLDADIVFHEYGHGLTWRMIGNMSGPMSGAIGEGMSDVLAMLLNGDDVIGEYSYSDPIGIRTAPYTNFPRTYSSVAGTEVHFDGEVYAAICWRLYQNYLAAGYTQADALDDIVDGMNYTPAGPKFEDMRDGILQSATNHGGARNCLVWEAFAHYGVGVGARARVRGSSIIITESFAMPTTCP